jgi:hypothetical protein
MYGLDFVVSHMKELLIVETDVAIACWIEDGIGQFNIVIAAHLDRQSLLNFNFYSFSIVVEYPAWYACVLVEVCITCYLVFEKYSLYVEVAEN